MVDCFVGLGGNFADTFKVMQKVAFRLKHEDGIEEFKLSRIYRTSPVSPIQQPFYLNAVCRFQTDIQVNALGQILQALEMSMGKKPKPKNHPRLIDLDLLFYGSLISKTEEWIIPHPRWHERLFVLVPLADVTEELPIVGKVRVKELLKRFTNPYNEKIGIFEGHE
ncbi:MAG TPA: 2-amino-4-hydroxy-6-hydroxymethyldihydropteridine diphosphokinase [Waddliaceae bacterium]